MLQENKQEESVSVAPGPAELGFVSYKKIRVIFFHLLLANNDKEECLQSLVKWNSPQGYSNWKKCVLRYLIMFPTNLFLFQIAYNRF